MNNEKAPEVTMTPDGIMGFDEFSQWAVLNVPLWRDIIFRCKAAGIPHDDAIKFIAYMQSVRADGLKRQLIHLHNAHGLPIQFPPDESR